MVYLYDYDPRSKDLIIWKKDSTYEYSLILDNIIFDFDNKGNLIGIEIESISKFQDK